MAFPDRRTSDILLTILLFAAVVAVVYLARRIIVIFIFAILFAYLINPLVRFLQHHSLFFKNLRGPHIVEVYLAFVLLVAFVSYVARPSLTRHAGTLFRELPAFVDGLSSGEVATRLANRYQWSEEQEIRVRGFLQKHREQIEGIVATAERQTSALLGALFLIPILAIFFLSSGAQLTEGLIQLCSAGGNTGHLRQLADELNTMFQSYIRAKVILASLSLLYCSTTMLVLGYSYALALGVAAGILEFIPVAGWMISATTILTVGVLTNSHWIWMAALLALWRMCMDYVISPRVVGHELEIHPLLTIFAFMVGGEIGGIVGIYLSVPLVAAIRVIWMNRMASCTPVAQTAAQGPGSH